MLPRSVWTALLVSTVALLRSGQLAGQVVNTQCWTTQSGMTQCSSQPGNPYSFQFAPTPSVQPGPFIPAPTGGDYFGQAASNLRNALAQAAYMRQMREQAAQQAQMQDQQRAALQAQEQAAADLYRERATAVVKHVVDSLMLSGVVAQHFVDSIGPTLRQVYQVNPLSTREQIAEALWPYTQAISNQLTEFIARVVPPMKPAVDSLHLSAEQQTPFLSALFGQVQQAFMENPEADSASVRARVQALFAQYRAAATDPGQDTTASSKPPRKRGQAVRRR